MDYAANDSFSEQLPIFVNKMGTAGRYIGFAGVLVGSTGELVGFAGELIGSAREKY